MIKLQFPKKPLSSQRKKATDFAKKLKYSENEYDIIAESEKLDDFKELFECIGGWQGVITSIDSEEIDFDLLNNISYCINNKVPFTNLKWYGVSKVLWRESDFRDFDNKIKSFSDKDSFFIESELDDLTNMGLIEVVEYKKKYNITKERFKEKIIKVGYLIRKIFPSFDYSEVISLIDKLPEEFDVISKNRDEPPSLIEPQEDEGEEWVDYYEPMKWHKDILDLLVKIEENTRKS